MRRRKCNPGLSILLLAICAVMGALPRAALAQYTATYLCIVKGMKYTTGVITAALPGEVLAAGHVPLGQTSKALIFTGPGDPIDITPANFNNPLPIAGNGTQEVGYGYNRDLGTGMITTAQHALLWNGTSSAAIDLNPAGYTQSQAQGLSATQQVGSVWLTSTTNVTQAFVWSGRAASGQPLDLGTFQSSVALATNGSQQVGGAKVVTPPNQGQIIHAVMWNGPGSSIIDLHPSGYTQSDALGIGGGQIVGNATMLDSSNNPVQHPMLWTGPSAADAVDLQPTIAGETFTYCSVLATNGTTQVGYGSSSDGTDHALAWNGSAGSAVDLGGGSVASYVDANGNIFGWDIGGQGADAIEWSPVPEPGLGVMMLGALGLLVRLRNRAQA